MGGAAGKPQASYDPNGEVPSIQNPGLRPQQTAAANIAGYPAIDSSSHGQGRDMVQIKPLHMHATGGQPQPDVRDCAAYSNDSSRDGGQVEL